MAMSLSIFKRAALLCTKMPREAVGPLATLSPTYTHILVKTHMPVLLLCLFFSQTLTFCKESLRIQWFTYSPLRLSHHLRLSGLHGGPNTRRKEGGQSLHISTIQ